MPWPQVPQALSSGVPAHPSHNVYPIPHDLKSFWIVLLLSLFFGIFGADRFYLGKYGTGILKLITIGGCGIWWMIDLIILLCGGQRDARGNRLLI